VNSIHARHVKMTFLKCGVIFMLVFVTYCNAEALLEDQEKFSLCAISKEFAFIWELDESPSDWFEVIMYTQGIGEHGHNKNISVGVQLQQERMGSPGDWIDIGEAWHLVLEEDLERNLREWNVKKQANWTDSGSALRFRFTTENEEPVAVSAAVLQLGAVGQHQVWIAGVLLVAVYILLVFELVHRTTAALIGAVVGLVILSILRERPSIAVIITWIDEGTIGLLLGMMIIIGVFSTTGFFEWVAIKCFKLSRGRVWVLLTVLCVSTAVLSAFLDNVTTIMLVAPVTLRLSRVVDLPPVPIILAEVFFSNIGGTATLIGDPPNIIIGSMLSKYISFADFIINLAPALIIAAPFCLLYLRIVFRNKLHDKHVENMDQLEREYRITDMPLFIKVCVVLGTVIIVFFMEQITHIEPAWIAMSGAAILLMIASPHEVEHFLEKVEWSTLLFFAGLFIFIEALKEMGLIRFIGDTTASIIGSVDEEQRLMVAIVLVMWLSAIVSAFIDNIPYTATMVPVILQLANDDTLGLPLKPLAWALAFGACLGGNGTIIGASANVVALGIMDRAGYKITFIQFMLYGMPIMFISVCFATAYMLVVHYKLGFDQD